MSLIASNTKISETSFDDFPGLFLNMDATSLVATHSNGEAITAVKPWVDQGPSANSFGQSIGARQPAFALTGLNSRPAVRFVNGSQEYLESNLVSAFDNTEFTAFIVSIFDGTPSSNAVWIGDADDQQLFQTWGLKNRDQTNTVQMGYGDNAASYILNDLNAAASDTSAHIFSFLRRGGGGLSDNEVRFDNQVRSITETSPGNSALTGTTSLFRIGIAGNLGSGTSYFDGWISQILIYTRKFSSSEMEKVNRILSQKWGVSI